MSDHADPSAMGSPPTAKSPPRLARAAGLISILTMFSRVLGLIREQLFAALLGATAFADAFNVAFRIPNLLRDLFAEGALSQAFVPTFKASLKQEGRQPAYVLANRIAGTLFFVIGTLVVIAGIFAPDIVSIMAGDFVEHGDGKFELTVLLTRVMLPFLAIVSVSAVAMGMLNAQDRYGAPALAPAMFNVMSIVVGAGLFASGIGGEAVAVGWAIGTVLGGVGQLVIQLPPLWKLDYRPRPQVDLRLRDPRVRRVALLMAPAVMGLAAVQLNIFVNTMFASTEEGAVSWLNYAFRFLQLPIGVFGVAIATVSTTRYADAAADGDRSAMALHLEEGLRLVAFLTVPATVGLLILGEPIIRLIYEHGRFSTFDTARTTAALEYFSVGLVAYAAVKVVAPAFYALDRARVAVIGSVTAVVANLTLNITLHPSYGYRILALGTATAALVNFTMLLTMFHVTVHRLNIGALLLYLLRVGAAAATMGAAAYGAHWQLDLWVGHSGLVAKALGALVPVGIGAISYGLVAHLMGLDELSQFLRRFSARLRRPRRAG